MTSRDAILLVLLRASEVSKIPVHPLETGRSTLCVTHLEKCSCVSPLPDRRHGTLGELPRNEERLGALQPQLGLRAASTVAMAIARILLAAGRDSTLGPTQETQALYSLTVCELAHGVGCLTLYSLAKCHLYQKSRGVNTAVNTPNLGGLPNARCSGRKLYAPARA